MTVTVYIENGLNSLGKLNTPEGNQALLKQSNQ